MPRYNSCLLGISDRDELNVTKYIKHGSSFFIRPFAKIVHNENSPDDPEHRFQLGGFAYVLIIAVCLSRLSRLSASNYENREPSPPNTSTSEAHHFSSSMGHYFLGYGDASNCFDIYCGILTPTNRYIHCPLYVCHLLVPSRFQSQYRDHYPHFYTSNSEGRTPSYG